MKLRRTHNTDNHHRILTLLPMSGKQTTIVIGVVLYVSLMMMGSFQQTRPSYVNENLYDLVVQPSLEEEQAQKQETARTRRLLRTSKHSLSTEVDDVSLIQKDLALFFPEGRSANLQEEDEEKESDDEVPSMARISVRISTFSSDREAQMRVNKLEKIIQQSVSHEFDSVIVVANEEAEVYGDDDVYTNDEDEDDDDDDDDDEYQKIEAIKEIVKTTVEKEFEAVEMQEMDNEIKANEKPDEGKQEEEENDEEEDVEEEKDKAEHKKNQEFSKEDGQIGDDDGDDDEGGEIVKVSEGREDEYEDKEEHNEQEKEREFSTGDGQIEDDDSDEEGASQVEGDGEEEGGEGLENLNDGERDTAKITSEPETDTTDDDFSPDLDEKRRRQRMRREKARRRQSRPPISTSPPSTDYGEDEKQRLWRQRMRREKAQRRLSNAATSTPSGFASNKGTAGFTPTEETVFKHDNYNYTNSVAGCLQIMDDNHFLIEWLAYHYHVMPLRRLIVFADPQSRTSPEPILDRWRDRIDITVWNESRIFKTWPHVFPERFNPTDKHRRRQRHFVYYCLKQLHSEGREWAFHTDTDEYIMINDDLRDPTKKISPLSKDGFEGSIPDQEEPGSVLKLLRQEGIQSPDTKRNTTHDPCINLARKTFGTREYNTSAQKLLLNAYNASDFQTFYWRYYSDKTLPGKCIMNLQLIDPTIDIWDGNGIHKPLGSNLCGQPTQYPSAKVAPLVVNHYQGTLHQLLFRSNDSRGHLTNGTHYRIERYNTYKQYDQKIESPTIQKWLPGFVKAVGEDAARDLLKDVGNPELAAAAAAASI